MVEQPLTGTAEVTVSDLIHWGEQQFIAENLYFGHGTDNAWDEAVILVLHGLGLALDADPGIVNQAVTESDKQAVLKLLNRRISERVPAAYITGEAWFSGLKFIVDERVLVPRSPIAELIEQGFAPWLTAKPESILDLCTGSGCIGITCAYAFPEARVTLSDISADALAVASINIEQHQLEGRAGCVESNLFDGLAGHQFDLIVSNPPYVDEQDFSSMPDEYRHEPEIGLSSGQDGLDFTRRLLAAASDHLTNNGIIVVEVGNSWLSLENSFPSVPFTWIEFERGGHGVFVLTREQLLQHRESFS